VLEFFSLVVYIELERMKRRDESNLLLFILKKGMVSKKTPQTTNAYVKNA
jgi:hypothetical protein